MAGGAEETYTTDDALTRAGFGRFQALVLAYACVGWIAEAMEIMLLSFVGVVREGGMGGVRRGGGAAVVTGTFGFLRAFSPNYSSLFALRFVVGLGLGAGTVLSTWFIEFVPAAKRGNEVESVILFNLEYRSVDLDHEFHRPDYYFNNTKLSQETTRGVRRL
ncbi:hypothetical protein ABZP36_000293 [Zizania latifolia]